MNIITVIVYKSSGFTSCRGCVMDQWDSKFEYRTFDNKDDAIQFAATYYYEDYFEFDNYEISYLINGVPLDTMSAQFILSDEQYELIEQYHSIDSLAKNIASEKYKIYKQEKELEKIEQEKRETETKVKKDLELLEKLKRQYEQ